MDAIFIRLLPQTSKLVIVNLKRHPNFVYLDEQHGAAKLTHQGIGRVLLNYCDKYGFAVAEDGEAIASLKLQVVPSEAFNLLHGSASVRFLNFSSVVGGWKG